MFEITETIAVVAIICTATTVQTMFEAGNTEYHDCVFGEPELPPYRDGERILPPHGDEAGTRS